jgi:hypothetical protein
MQNKPRNRTSAYAQHGVLASKTPGGRAPRRGRLRLRPVLLLLLAVALVALAFWGLPRLFSGGLKPIYLNDVLPGHTIRAFGKNALCYNGTTLTCVAANGRTQWSFTIGAGGDFVCTESEVVAWNGGQVYVLDKNGQLAYSDRMEGTVRFARAGRNYIAICFGDAMNSTLRVLTRQGALLENITTLSDLYLMDVGFFSGGQLMWVLALDVAGNAPVTQISTYEPGRMSTGVAELDNEMVYRVYERGDLLMAADTSKIRAYNYRCVEQTDIAPVLIYGWTIRDVRTVSRNLQVLLEEVPQGSGRSGQFSDLRLVTNDSVTMLRLLAPCFASGLSDAGVYGFAGNAIYFAPYGSHAFEAHYLTFGVEQMHCILDGGVAVMSDGAKVFMMALPR